LETVISIRFDETVPQREIDYKKHRDTGKPFRAVNAQPENKTEEKRLGTDLLTEFVQGASKSGSVEDFMCYCSSNLLKCL
jgi:hypothetical protein